MFDINGQAYRVMIDTGATVSCIPEFGDIMKYSRARLEKANLTVELANGVTSHISSKVKGFLRPAGSSVRPQQVQFYVQSNSRDLFGFHALIGLKQLKLFELQIRFKNGTICIFHQDKLIGYETPALTKTQAGIRVIDKVSQSCPDIDIKRILSRYKAAFIGLDANPIKGSSMKFYTVHQRPIFAKQRHYNQEEIIAMKQHIRTLLNKGIIEPTNSGYAATSRIIPKKDGSGRLVINYIPLNAVTHRDSYALPHITDILSVLTGKQYFTTMDCTQGFYQIEVDQRYRHKTAFSTPFGNFQFRRCPFGARNSCAEFQAAMNRIFHDGLYTRCVIYVDDILVFGNTKQEHDENLEWVLQQAVENNVKIKLEKCFFAQTRVRYLGFMISGKSIEPIADKVGSLLQSRPPQDKTELRSIIGKLNFYSRFIPNYSKQLEPLRNLLVNSKDFQWREYHQEAFKVLIKRLNNVNYQILAPTNQHKIVSLLVSPDSIETMLLSSENQLITRASRLLSTAEANYCETEKQLLALVFAVNKYRIYLNPNSFTVRTSSKQLEKAINMVHKPDRVENLLLKMPAGFDTFNFEIDDSIPTHVANNRSKTVAEEIFYIDGACKNNGKPNCRSSWAVCTEYNQDLESSGLVETNPSNQSAEVTAAIKACEIAKENGLKNITIVTDSKYLYSAATLWIDKWKSNGWKDHKNKPVINVELFKSLLYAKQGLEIEWIHVKGHSNHAGNIRADNLARSLLDSKAVILNTIATSGTRLQQDDPEVDDIKLLAIEDPNSKFQIIDDVLYYMDSKLPEGNQERIFVPTTARHWLLTLAHDDIMYGGHLGIKRTFRKLIRFWWPQMHKDVENYVKSCDICQRFKNPVGLQPGYLHSIPVSRIFEHVHIDLVGPLKTTYRGNKYIVTATDAFSKWAFARPLQGIRTNEIIDFVEQSIICIHGKPEQIITDRGTQFTSSEWKKFVDGLGIEHKLTSPYHPQSNGIDERFNGTLVRMLRAYVDKYQEDWDEKLIWSLCNYNQTVHESTGYSPYQILHGLDPRSPLKPSRLTLDDTESLDDLRQSIRLEVNQRNESSQELQKRYYDRHRREPNLYTGQLVYIRNHSAPLELTRKFYQKWHGPVMITGFIGDQNKPRAVVVFDTDHLIRKVVAVSDVKPAYDSYERPSDTFNQNQNGEGNNLNDISLDSQDNTESTFHYLSDDLNTRESSVNSQSAQSPDKTTVESYDSDLNITPRTISGPTSSSPRRVTISDRVSTFHYPTDANNNQASENDNLSEKTESPPPRESVLPDIDNPRRDPTYKPPPHVKKSIPKKTSTQTTTRDDITPIKSPYALRSKIKVPDKDGVKSITVRSKPYPSRDHINTRR